MHGWIILDKPLGLGSTQAVSAVKRALRQGGYGKAKVGHGGTLDPLATGVLPVAVGEATKLAGRLLDGDKTYAFTIRFGEETDTLDAEGKIVATSSARPTPAEIEAALPRFTGPLAQVPPAYSALKIDGARAYDLARAGQEVTLASRQVTIHALTLQSSPARGRWRAEGVTEGEDRANASDSPPPPSGCSGHLPLAEEERVDELTLVAHVSKGTYIRSLARDIARTLGTVGHVTMLRRTHAGPFSLAPALSLDKLRELATAGALEQALQPLTSALDDIPVLPVTPDQASALRQGRTIGIAAGPKVSPGFAFAMLDDVPVAYVEIEDARMRVVRGFNL